MENYATEIPQLTVLMDVMLTQLIYQVTPKLKMLHLRCKLLHRIDKWIPFLVEINRNGDCYSRGVFTVISVFHFTINSWWWLQCQVETLEKYTQLFPRNWRYQIIDALEPVAFYEASSISSKNCPELLLESKFWDSK